MLIFCCHSSCTYRRNVIIWHYTSLVLRTFRLTACRTTIATIWICLIWIYAFLVQCIAVRFRGLFTILKEGAGTAYDFRFPPRCKWDMHSFGILHVVERYIFTTVSGHPICPIFKGPPVLLVPKRHKETTVLRHVKSLNSTDLKVLELLPFGS